MKYSSLKAKFMTPVEKKEEEARIKELNEKKEFILKEIEETRANIRQLEAAKMEAANETKEVKTSRRKKKGKQSDRPYTEEGKREHTTNREKESEATSTKKHDDQTDRTMVGKEDEKPQHNLADYEQYLKVLKEQEKEVN